jgi:hypothetical protein
VILLGEGITEPGQGTNATKQHQLRKDFLAHNILFGCEEININIIMSTINHLIPQKPEE